MAPSTHSADVSQIQADTTAILVDTGTTIPATIATVDGNVDSILVDTGTTIPATIATVDGNVDAILVDTGTTIPGTIATVDTNVDTMLAAQTFPFSSVSKETATLSFSGGVYAEARDWVVSGNWAGSLTVQLTFTLKSDSGSLVTCLFKNNGVTWVSTFSTTSAVPVVQTGSGDIESGDIISLWGVTAGGATGIINMFSLGVGGGEDVQLTGVV